MADTNRFGSIDKDDLDAMMSGGSKAVPCVSVTNRTPSGWGVRIGGSARFIYKDGSTEDDYHTAVDIGSGQTLELCGTKTACCREIRTVVIARWQEDGEMKEKKLGAVEKAEEKKCLLRVRYSIGPKKLYDESDVEGVAGLLEVYEDYQALRVGIGRGLRPSPPELADEPALSSWSAEALPELVVHVDVNSEEFLGRPVVCQPQDD